ncbi:MAG: SGNH/GDSL hydrolase family protein [Lentisphaerae bacterium]|jgi:hypothetical protein|nr:SGNH/GDSL hydrolase family protein [Lentisphaerota bacterium]
MFIKHLGSAITLSCLLASTLAWGQHNLSGVYGIINGIDQAAQSCFLLTSTTYDPQTQEGTCKHQIFWNDKTVFNITKTMTAMTDIKPDDVVLIDLVAAQAALAQEGKPFQAARVIVQPAGTKAVVGWANSAKTRLMTTVTPLAATKGEITLDGQKITFSARPQALQKTELFPVAELKNSLTQVRVFGALQEDGRFLCSLMQVTPLPDPRLTDDPNLPRVLVIGDSISMNYHEAAKQALAGKANYYRINGNSGDTNRGVANFALWLGDTSVKGLHWDVVVINHGLHDLRLLDGDVHQVSLEQYRKNLEAIFTMAVSKDFKVIWCTTTPVPGTRTSGSRRRKDDDKPYNQVAAEVLRKFPSITVCDLNAFVRGSSVFDQWRLGVDVHFKDEERVALGQKVAETILSVLQK